MECVQLDFCTAPPPRARLALHRAWVRALRRRGAGLTAFGWGRHEVRLVLGQPGFAVAARRIAALRGWPVFDVRIVLSERVAPAMTWAHAVGWGPPLSRPWTSHRDHLGFRHAGWVQQAPRRVATEVHHRLGGGRLPAAGVLAARVEGKVLRAASASVLGCLQHARCCRSLTASAALAAGYGTIDAACIAGLTPRRVRQLRTRRDPRVHAVLATVADPRLAVPLTERLVVDGRITERRTEGHARARPQ